MAEIVRRAEWDTIKSDVFARTAIRYIQSLPEVRLLKKTVVMFDEALRSCNFITLIQAIT